MPSFRPSRIGILSPKIGITGVILGILVFAIGSNWNPGEMIIDLIQRSAWLNAVYSIALLIIVSLASSGIGWVLLDRIGIPDSRNLAAELIALSLGFGIIAYGVFVIGISGFLTSATLLGWLVLVGLAGVSKWRRLVSNLKNLGTLGTSLRKLDFFKKVLLMVGVGILILTFFQAIAPPWDYDSQLYHLEVPRIFLTKGKIVPLPDQWLSYFPLTLEMLFTLGMGLGSDVFAKLVHLAFSLILVFSTYSFGNRYIGSRAAWLAAGVLVGIPILPVWAGWAYVDMGLAVYIFLSAYAAINWGENRKTSWLVLSGMLMGFGLGVKYMCLGAAVSVGILVLWLSLNQGWKVALTNVLVYGGVALVIGSPWYLKNFLWTGNPIYPLGVGPPDWSPYHLKIWMSFIQGFGTGTTLWDFILLPVNLYLHHERFTTGMGSIEFPSLLFPLVILYPWTRRKRPLDGLTMISFIQFLFWAIGSQVNRYLLPIYPFLSLLAGHVLEHLEITLQRGRLGYIIGRSLVLGMVSVTFAYSIIYFAQIMPLRYILGNEAKSVFLQRVVEDYAAIEFVKSNLSKDARVLMLWDGRGYYCGDLCMPDIDHSQWTDITLQAQWDINSVTRILRTMKVTHLLICIQDLDYILQHDPLHYQREAFDFFLEKYRPVCTKKIFDREGSAVYELTCQ